MPSPPSAPLSLSELNDSLWLALLRWLRFGDGLLSPDSSLSDTEESLLDFRLDLPVLPSLSASSSCLCLASHHICCRWTTSGYLACKYNKHQLGSTFNYTPWSVNFTVINFILQEVALVVGITCNRWCNNQSDAVHGKSKGAVTLENALCKKVHSVIRFSTGKICYPPLKIHCRCSEFSVACQKIMQWTSMITERVSTSTLMADVNKEQVEKFIFGKTDESQAEAADSTEMRK